MIKMQMDISDAGLRLVDPTARRDAGHLMLDGFVQSLIPFEHILNVFVQKIARFLTKCRDL